MTNVVTAIRWQVGGDGQVSCRHVDNYEFLHDFAELLGYKYGGITSFCMPEGSKPLMIIGHDECVF